MTPTRREVSAVQEQNNKDPDYLDEPSWKNKRTILVFSSLSLDATELRLDSNSRSCPSVHHFLAPSQSLDATNLRLDSNSRSYPSVHLFLAPRQSLDATDFLAPSQSLDATNLRLDSNRRSCPSVHLFLAPSQSSDATILRLDSNRQLRILNVLRISRESRKVYVKKEDCAINGSDVYMKAP